MLNLLPLANYIPLQTSMDPDKAQQKVGPDLNPKLFDSLTVFL